MAAQKGRLLLVKIGNGLSPATYSTIAGVRAKTITVNNEPVDITDADSAPFRQLMADAGLRSCSLHLQGIFKDGTAENRLKRLNFEGAIESFQVTWPNGDTLEGEFFCQNFQTEGPHDNAEAFSCTLESASSFNFVQG